MFKNLLIGVDEREGGRDAIALAKTLLAADGELTLAHVFVENEVGSRVWRDPGVDVAGAPSDRRFSLLPFGQLEQAPVE
jgi:hypothetical protein